MEMGCSASCSVDCRGRWICGDRTRGNVQVDEIVVTATRGEKMTLLRDKRYSQPTLRLQLDYVMDMIGLRACTYAATLFMVGTVEIRGLNMQRITTLVDGRPEKCRF